MMAELFLAVAAGKTFVCHLRKPFGMAICHDLPIDQQQQRQAEKRIGEPMRHKHKGGKHHRVIPVIDPTASAALVLHHPGLEGTEEQDADHITNRIRQTDQHENAGIDHARQIEDTDGAIQQKPEQQHLKDTPSDERSMPFLGGTEIPSELLLASHAFQARGEEAQNHLDSENRADHRQEQRLRADHSERLLRLYTVKEIQHQGGKKQGRSEDQLEIMQRRNGGKTSRSTGHRRSFP